MDIIKYEGVLDKVIDIRGQKVILDSEVAELYGIETKRVNEAVKNNLDKFPEGYLIELTSSEWEPLKSKFSTSIKGGKMKSPKAFTEKGLYMLATILKSKQATDTTLAIIETFSKIRELSRTIKELSVIKDEKEKKGFLQRSGELMTEVFEDGFFSSESETTIELNFAVLKLKHTVKKGKK